MEKTQYDTKIYHTWENQIGIVTIRYNRKSYDVFYYVNKSIDGEVKFVEHNIIYKRKRFTAPSLDIIVDEFIDYLRNNEGRSNG